MAMPIAASPLRALVSLEALRHNLARVRRALRADTELIACVKANAYGHGLRAVAGCLEAEGVRWLSLGSPAEARARRRRGITSDVCLLASEPGVGPSLADVAASQGRSPLEVLVSLTGRAVYEYSGDMIGNSVRPGSSGSGARQGRRRAG